MIEPNQFYLEELLTRLTLILGLLLTFNSFAVVANAAPAPASVGGTTSVSGMTREETKLFDLVNKERASRGLSQLAVDPVLIDAARKHSQEMADKDYFSHTSPTPGLSTPMDRFLASEGHRPSWALVGENLFYCSIVDVDRGHTAFMNSKGHRDNILEPRFERMGIGVYIDNKGQFFVTQMFLAKTE